MRYTQENVTIEDSERNVVATSYWNSVFPENEEIDGMLVQFGSFGYYSNWEI